MKNLRLALNGILAELYPDVKIWQGDVREPVTRSAFKLYLFPSRARALCGGERERTVEVDLYYYAATGRDECEEVAEVLTDAFVYGFAVNGVWVYLDDEISFELLSEKVFVCSFSVSWTETMSEDDDSEPMENLFLDEEELIHGSDDAEG